MNWIKAWLIEIIGSLIAGLICALAAGLHPFAAAVFLWVLLPLSGALFAFRAVRRGLLNYAAWIAPPVMLYVAFMLLWGYAPPAGAALLCALISLIGAAAGEVYNQRYK